MKNKAPSLSIKIYFHSFYSFSPLYKLVIPAMSVIVLSVLMLGELPKMFAILISACMLIINISVFYLYNTTLQVFD